MNAATPRQPPHTASHAPRTGTPQTAIAQLAPPKRSFYVATDRKPLGKGTFGTVYRGVDQSNCEAVAVKLVSKSKLKPCDLDSQRLEGAMMRKAGAHPNILRLVDSGEDAKHIYLVTPVIAGGDLKEIVRGTGTAYDDNSARKLLRGLLSGIAHMHSRGVMHRDIKLDNILMRPSKDETKLPTDPVLMDFGFATDVARPNMFCGTVYYVAPEVIEAGQSRDFSVHYDNKCDVWSFGVVAYMLLQQGDRPFTGRNVRECCLAIATKRPTFDKPISPEARDFVESLLAVDPRKRPAAAEALEHPWLKGNTSSVFLNRSALLKSLQRSSHRGDAPLSFACGDDSDDDARSDIVALMPGECSDASVRSIADPMTPAGLPAVDAMCHSYHPETETCSNINSDSKSARSTTRQPKS